MRVKRPVGDQCVACDVEDGKFTSLVLVAFISEANQSFVLGKRTRNGGRWKDVGENVFCDRLSRLFAPWIIALTLDLDRFKFHFVKILEDTAGVCVL